MGYVLGFASMLPDGRGARHTGGRRKAVRTTAPLRDDARMSDARWIVPFDRGGRDMRELLGGKGANVAEMTRVLGADRVPTGFTITTEACVALHARATARCPTASRTRSRPRWRALEERAGKRLGDAGRPAAGLGPLGRARVDAGDDGHGPEPRAQRRLGRGAGRADATTRASRGTRTGASCRCSATSAAASPASASRPRSPRASVRRASSDDVELGADDLRGARRRLQGDLHRADRRGVPAGSGRAAAAGDPRRVRLVGRQARRDLPADQPHPRRLGHRLQRPADGVRQQGRHVVLGRRVQPRRGDRRARAVGRLPRQRPGRGRRLRRAHAARPRADGRRDARGARRADADPAHARGALPRHAGHGVHRRGGPAVHAADAQRQAPGAGRRALRGRRGRRGAARRAREALATIDAASARRAPAPHVRPGRATFDVLATGVAASPGAAKGQIVFTPDDAVDWAQRGRARSCSCARSPRPTTCTASSPRRGSSPPRAARPRTPRSSRAGWASRAWPARRRCGSTSRRASCASATRCCARAT